MPTSSPSPIENWFGTVRGSLPSPTFLPFAVRVTEARGHVSDADVAAVRLAGYGDAEIVEIVLHVALNTLTNYVNEVARTELDFPAVAARSAA